MAYDEIGEWRAAVDDMSETDRAPYDDPQEYDTYSPDGVRL